jgi:hypothetical protein
VEVPCDEGVAIRIGPEPCAGTRDGVGEASAGARERERPPARRGRRPWHARTRLAREPGDLGSDPPRYRAGPHREGEEP